MIRGSIEVAQRTQIAGWIYAEAGTVRDRLILAFSGERCVGAGKVERFRSDLLEAKLGDGYCGFEFPIRLNDDETLGSVVVKLQNADVALIQRDTRLAGRNDIPGSRGEPDLGAIPPARVSWMQDRGWLEQHEHDFLRAVQTLGVYERGLRPARRANAELPPLLKPEHLAQDMMGLYALGEIEIVRSRVASISDLGLDGSPLQGAGLSIMALWSSENCRIAVEERSHMRVADRRARVTPAPAAGAIDYAFGPDRILFLHRHASFAPRGPAPAGGIIAFTAVARALAPSQMAIAADRAA